LDCFAIARPEEQASFDALWLAMTIAVRDGALPARMATVYVPSAFGWRTVLCVARCVAAFLEAIICRKSEFVVLLVFAKVFYSRRPRLINPGADPKPALADPSANRLKTARLVGRKWRRNVLKSHKTRRKMAGLVAAC
jgi:hypothetical protein